MLSFDKLSSITWLFMMYSFALRDINSLSMVNTYHADFRPVSPHHSNNAVHQLVHVLHNADNTTFTRSNILPGARMWSLQTYIQGLWLPMSGHTTWSNIHHRSGYDSIWFWRPGYDNHHRSGFRQTFIFLPRDGMVTTYFYFCRRITGWLTTDFNVSQQWRHTTEIPILIRTKWIRIYCRRKW